MKLQQAIAVGFQSDGFDEDITAGMGGGRDRKVSFLISGELFSISPQCLHLMAASWISSAQYGHWRVHIGGLVEADCGGEETTGLWVEPEPVFGTVILFPQDGHENTIPPSV